MTGYEIEHNLEQRLRNWSLDPIEQLLYLKLKIIANEMGLISQKFKVSNSELEFRVGISNRKLCYARENLVKSGIFYSIFTKSRSPLKPFGKIFAKVQYFFEIKNIFYKKMELSIYLSIYLSVV